MIKHLIKSTEELQKFVRVNISVIEDSFLPYQLAAREKFLTRYLGDDLQLIITDLSNDQTYPDWATTNEKKSILDKVLFLTQNALAKFTLYIAAPHLDLHLSEMGFVVTHTESMTPASAERVKKAVDAYLSQGYDSLETLLRFLEANHQEIPCYKDSDAFVFSTSNLITSTAEFDRIISIDQSRLRFISMIPEMTNIETLKIAPVISQALLSKIILEKRTGELTPPNKTLLLPLQRSLAHYVVSNLTPVDKMHEKDRLMDYARNYLAICKRMIDANSNDYPLYKTSSAYSDPRQLSIYENDTDDPDNRLFIFGQPSS